MDQFVTFRKRVYNLWVSRVAHDTSMYVYDSTGSVYRVSQ